MAVVKLLPAFSLILDSVQNPALYLHMMYLSIVVFAGICTFFVSFIGRGGAGLLWSRPLPLVLSGFGFAALFVYLGFFTDLTTTFTRTGRPFLFVVTSSPFAFVISYCLVIPLFVAAPAAVGIKSLYALMRLLRNRFPGSSDPTSPGSRD